MSASGNRPLLEGEALRQRICLYLYGELSPEERREVERCRAEDPAFAALFSDEEAFLRTLDDTGLEAELNSLLAQCRSGLLEAVAHRERLGPEASPARRLQHAVRRWGAAVAARRLIWQPVAAALLLAAGFLTGRISAPHADGLAAGTLRSAPGGMSPGEALPTLTGVHAVQLDPDAGHVRIVVEERRVVSGPSSDPAIRNMLVDSMQMSHEGARLSTLEALREHADDEGVRRAVLRSLLEADNPGVRLQALEAVRGHAALPDVREALLETLRSDPHAGMRVQAIQTLSEHPGRDLAGTLQAIREREPNPYVLEQSERILEALGASLERY